jgi:hypothetical protein
MYSQEGQIITKKITNVNEDNILLTEKSPETRKGKTSDNMRD